MKKQIYLYLASILIFTAGSSFAAAEEKGSGKGGQKVEESAAREERGGWFERIFGLGQDRDKTEQSEEAAQQKEKSVKKEKAKAKQAHAFSDKERAILEDWQRGETGWKKSGKKLPPGLQKKVARGGELPPGWKKKLAIGEKLPEEYESEIESLPEEILARLPKTSAGTEILQIGDEIIRVVENTREIIDILGINQGRAKD